MRLECGPHGVVLRELTRGVLGMDQLSGEFDLENAAERRYEVHSGNVRLILVEECFSQANGLVGVVSLDAVLDLDGYAILGEDHVSLLQMCNRLYHTPSLR